MNKSIVVKFFLGALFLSVSIYSFMKYFEFRNAFLEGKPIVYSLIEKRINKGSRGGDSYKIVVEYNKSEQTVTVTSQDFDLIDKGKYPELYYSQYSDSVFSKWSVKVSLRVAILFLLLSIMSIIPWNKVIKQESSN